MNDDGKTRDERLDELLLIALIKHELRWEEISPHERGVIGERVHRVIRVIDHDMEIEDVMIRMNHHGFPTGENVIRD